MVRNLFLGVLLLAGCGQVDERRHIHNDAAGPTCNDQTACKDGDDCCPETCNANNDKECMPKCGNNVVEMGETCDGNCPTCAAETLTCFTQQTGTAANCDVTCHIPQQTCTAGDTCCPFVMGQGGNACSMSTDSDCRGAMWKFVEVDWGNARTWVANGTVTNRIYGINGGDSILLTTCTPDGSANTSDTVILKVADQNGVVYSANQDDTMDPGALPRLAGWHCEGATAGFPMSTAPQNPGGFIVGANSGILDVTLGGHNGAAGSARLFIWWNGTSFPNSG